jgi:hypothetical protein
MLTEEMENWMTQHNEEKDKRINFQQQVKVLEEKIESINRNRTNY